MIKRRGPWTQGKLNKLRYDIRGYFRAYYSELRKHIAAHDPSFQNLPIWFKGGRKIQGQACADGVMIVHRPYDEETCIFPDREDSYEFFLSPDMPVKEAVARMVPTQLAGENATSLLDYQPGEGFGAVSYEEPFQLNHPLGDDDELIEEVGWTRLDCADLDNLTLWRDKSEARKNARKVLSSYLML